MRKHYLDNIRTIIILLLFPYHTFMVWNNFGTKFYIWGGTNNILSSLIVLMSSWIMPVLFVIAGMSARYSLEKRSTKEFVKERIKKILLPFISGLIVLIPFQTLYARKFFFDYSGGIIDNYKYFFTHFSDLNGYDGMFTLGHLWFLLYLFIIVLITLPIIKKIPFSKMEKNKMTKCFKKISYPIYILHQTILVIIGYYTLMMIDNIFWQVSIIILGSLTVTMIACEIICKIPSLKKVVGI